MPSCAAVACPKDYDYVFRTYRGFLYGVLYNSGVPPHDIDDASGEIWLRMLGQDGLDRYDGQVTENPPRIKSYLAAYFSLSARAELTRIHTRESRTTILEPQIEPEPPEVFEDTELLDSLLATTSGDARHFVQVASEYPTYTKARACLVAEGWDTPRIRQAVKTARAAVRGYLCDHR